MSMTNPLEALPDAVAVPEKPWVDSIIGQLRWLVAQGIERAKPYTDTEVDAIAPWGYDDLPEPIREYLEAKIGTTSAIVFPMIHHDWSMRTIFDKTFRAMRDRCIREWIDMVFLADQGNGLLQINYSTPSEERAQEFIWRRYKVILSSKERARALKRAQAIQRMWGLPILPPVDQDQPEVYNFQNMNIADLNGLPVRSFTQSLVWAERAGQGVEEFVDQSSLLCREVDEVQHWVDRENLTSVLSFFWLVNPRTFARIAQILSVSPDSQFRFLDDRDCIRNSGDRGIGRIPNDRVYLEDTRKLGDRNFSFTEETIAYQDSRDAEEGNTSRQGLREIKIKETAQKYDVWMAKLEASMWAWVYDTDKQLLHFFTLDERIQWEIVEYVLTWTHIGDRFNGLIWLIYAHNLISKKTDPRISSEFLRCLDTIKQMYGDDKGVRELKGILWRIPLVIMNSPIGIFIKDQLPLVYK